MDRRQLENHSTVCAQASHILKKSVPQTVVCNRKQDGNKESILHLCIYYANDIVNISSIMKNNIYAHIYIYVHTPKHIHHSIYTIQKYTTALVIQ